MFINELFFPCTASTPMSSPLLESCQQQLSDGVLLSADSTHTNQIPVFKHFLWLVLAVTLGIHPMLAQELVTFQCLLSCMCNTNFASVEQGHRIQRQSWEQEIPLHLVWWTSRVMVHSVQSVLGFVFVSYNFQFLQQDFLIQTGTFCLVNAYFFNVRKILKCLYFITRVKICWAR